MVSDEEILLRVGLTLTIGGERLDVSPLTMGQSLRWREKLGPILGRVLADFGEIETAEDVTAAFYQSPKDMAAVVASYIGMEFDEFLEKATEPEVFTAFAKIHSIALRPIVVLEALRPSFSTQKRADMMAKVNGQATSPTLPM